MKPASSGTMLQDILITAVNNSADLTTEGHVFAAFFYFFFIFIFFYFFFFHVFLLKPYRSKESCIDEGKFRGLTNQIYHLMNFLVEPYFHVGIMMHLYKLYFFVSMKNSVITSGNMMYSMVLKISLNFFIFMGKMLEPP